MDFDTLPKAIADFWQFLFAPIITVTFVLLIIGWIGGAAARARLRALFASTLAVLTRQESRHAAKAFWPTQDGN